MLIIMYVYYHLTISTYMLFVIDKTAIYNAYVIKKNIQYNIHKFNIEATCRGKRTT
jgi:hypothetical protein